MSITPEKVQELLDAATPGPWHVSDPDSVAPVVSGAWMVAIVPGDDDDRPWEDELDEAVQSGAELAVLDQALDRARAVLDGTAPSREEVDDAG